MVVVMPTDNGAIEVKETGVGRLVASRRSIARTIEELKRLGVANPKCKKTGRVAQRCGQEDHQLTPERQQDLSGTREASDSLSTSRHARSTVSIVYKVDRFSRSLMDFARIIKFFVSHNVSFVSVTKPFNIATSMGRMVLNVLLSFAQFECEMTSKRVRDKVAASQRRH